MHVEILRKYVRICFHEGHDLLPLKSLDLPRQVHSLVYLVLDVLSLKILQVSGDLRVIHF